MRVVFCIAVCAAVSLCAGAQDERATLKRKIDVDRRAGRTAATEPLLIQLLELETQASGEWSEDLTPILDHLARIALSSNHYDRAEELYRRAIGIVQKAQGRSSPALIPMLQALVRSQQIAQKFPEAVGTQMRVISIRMNSKPELDADLAGDYAVLARIYAAQSNFLQAATFYNWALEMLEKLYGLDDARLLTPLDGLASALRQDHKFEEASAVLLRIVSIREAVVGPMHPDLAQTLDYLGAVYFEMKRFSEAETPYQRSLPIWIRHLGPSHPMVATSLDNLGVTYASQNKFEQAEQVYRQALAIRDAEDSASLRNLALVLAGSKKYGEAELYFKRALALLGAGKPSPDLVSMLHDYADTLTHLRRKAEAARVLLRAKKLEADIPAAPPGGKAPAEPAAPGR